MDIPFAGINDLQFSAAGGSQSLLQEKFMFPDKMQEFFPYHGDLCGKLILHRS